MYSIQYHSLHMSFYSPEMVYQTILIKPEDVKFDVFKDVTVQVLFFRVMTPCSLIDV
jgi:hypothetical protein